MIGEATLRWLKAQGKSIDDAIALAAALSADNPQTEKDTQAERRRAADRERKRAARQQSETKAGKECPRNVRGMSADPPPNDIYSNPPPIPPSPSGDTPKPSKSKKGARLQADWKPEQFKSGTKAAEVANRRGKAWLDDQFERFRSHFLAKPGSAGLSLDWQQNWNGWVLRGDDFTPNQRGSPGSPNPPNFSKIGGKYS